jgi:hypothetical protein
VFGSYLDIISLRHAAIEKMWSCFDQLFADANHEPSLRKFTFWPLFVAGIEACDGPERVDRGMFITYALHNLSYLLGDLSLLEVVAFLQSVW